MCTNAHLPDAPAAEGAVHRELLEVVLKPMRRNSYMTHEENVLLVMFGDKAAYSQAEGVAIVRQLRHRPEAERTQVRSFRAPTVSTDAQSYT